MNGARRGVASKESGEEIKNEIALSNFCGGREGKG